MRYIYMDKLLLQTLLIVVYIAESRVREPQFLSLFLNIFSLIFPRLWFCRSLSSPFLGMSPLPPAVRPAAHPRKALWVWHEGSDTRLFVYGAAGVGKTTWARQQFANPLHVYGMSDLRWFDPELHDGIVFDGLPIEIMVGFESTPRRGILGNARMIFVTNEDPTAALARAASSADVVEWSALPDPPAA